MQGPCGHGMAMRYPATRWQDALPTGSGVVGALMYGSIQSDTILFNHDGLFYPMDPPATTDVSDQLPEVRRLISEGRSRDAAQRMAHAYAERVGTNVGSTSKGRSPYQPFCALQVGMATDGPFRAYRRGVDFETGRVWMRWSDETSTVTRELFVSRISDAIYLRIRNEGNDAVDCRLALIKAVNEQVDVGTFSGSKPSDFNVTVTSEVSAEDATLLFGGRYVNGFSFCAVGRVYAPGGSLCAQEGELVVAGADEVVLEVRLFLDMEASEARAHTVAEPVPSFDVAYAEHAAAHAALFNRVALKLGPAAETNEEMLMAAYDGDVPLSLTRTMFEFGRHLLICSSRPGGAPANLQGLWNGDYAPAWNSDVHTDENIQMNYWQALPGALPETLLPLFDYVEKHLDDFRANARNIFGCRGILVPIAMTTHGREIPCVWSNWTAAAGWIGQHFQDYYLFTGDREFLGTRLIPWLKEVALFYEDFLLEDASGQLLFTPSISPENAPTGLGSLLTMNATMDVAVCREVLSNLCEGCELLEIESDGVARWRAMLAKLPAYEINGDGAMREWLHPAFKDNYHHRHQSHVYPVFPGLEVTQETDPAIYEACRVAVEKRLVIGLTSQTGWSMAHMANIYARLGQGDRALECLDILARASTGPNLFTYHNDWRRMGLSCGWGKQPPFQIDANLGMTAAVLEMLLFSKPGLIKLLPALPEKWSSGQVKGIACRGGAWVDMAWDRSHGSLQATITSSCSRTVCLRLPEWVVDHGLDRLPEAEPAVELGTGYWRLAMASGKPLHVGAEQ